MNLQSRERRRDRKIVVPKTTACYKWSNLRSFLTTIDSYLNP